jgi:hypothetical protein
VRKRRKKFQREREGSLLWCHPGKKKGEVVTIRERERGERKNGKKRKEEIQI